MYTDFSLTRRVLPRGYEQCRVPTLLHGFPTPKHRWTICEWRLPTWRRTVQWHIANGCLLSSHRLFVAWRSVHQIFGHFHFTCASLSTTPWACVKEWLHAFLTSALDGGEWAASRLGRCEEPSYPLDRRLRGPQSRSGIPVPAGNRTPVVQLLA
jgi:hypothetical protein